MALLNVSASLATSRQRTGRVVLVSRFASSFCFLSAEGSLALYGSRQACAKEIHAPLGLFWEDSLHHDGHFCFFFRSLTRSRRNIIFQSQLVYYPRSYYTMYLVATSVGSVDESLKCDQTLK